MDFSYTVTAGGVVSAMGAEFPVAIGKADPMTLFKPMPH